MLGVISVCADDYIDAESDVIFIVDEDMSINEDVLTIVEKIPDNLEELTQEGYDELESIKSRPYLINVWKDSEVINIIYTRLSYRKNQRSSVRFTVYQWWQWFHDIQL